jgi:hypothetical protein
MITDNQKILTAAEIDAQYDPLNPSRSITLNGHVITITYITVNRKCYDHNTTPTRQFKVDGKRVSRSSAYKFAI